MRLGLAYRLMHEIFAIPSPAVVRDVGDEAACGIAHISTAFSHLRRPEPIVVAVSLEGYRCHFGVSDRKIYRRASSRCKSEGVAWCQGDFRYSSSCFSRSVRRGSPPRSRRLAALLLGLGGSTELSTTSSCAKLFRAARIRLDVLAAASNSECGGSLGLFSCSVGATKTCSLSRLRHLEIRPRQTPARNQMAILPANLPSAC